MTNELNCKKCYIYVLDTLADWEIGFITAELNSRRYFAKNKKLDLAMIGNTLKPIKTMGGNFKKETYSSFLEQILGWMRKIKTYWKLYQI